MELLLKIFDILVNQIIILNLCIQKHIVMLDGVKRIKIFGECLNKSNKNIYYLNYVLVFYQWNISKKTSENKSHVFSIKISTMNTPMSRAYNTRK